MISIAFLLFISFSTINCFQVHNHKGYNVYKDEFVISELRLDDVIEKINDWRGKSDTTSYSRENLQHVVVTATHEDVKAADYLSQRWFGTKSRAYEACKKGLVKLNGKKIFSTARLSNGGLLEIDFCTKDTPSLAEEMKNPDFLDKAKKVLNFSQHILSKSNYQPPLHILYENDVLAVVFKPAGVHTMQWIGTMKKKTLALADVLPIILKPPQSPLSHTLEQPLPCHRLDARVSGCVLVAKTHFSLSVLKRQFEDRVVKKEYRAILCGDLKTKLIAEQNSLIYWKEKDNILAGFIDDPIDDRCACTEIQILEVTKCAVYGSLTTVTLYPHTGRRHQLRRHCALLGCPIVGDDLYHDAAYLRFGEERMNGVKMASLLGKQQHEIQGRIENSAKNIPTTQHDQLSQVSTGDSTQRMKQIDLFNTISIPKVRKGVGLYLMCTAIEFDNGLFQKNAMPLENHAHFLSELHTDENTGKTNAKNTSSDETSQKSGKACTLRIQCAEIPRFRQLREKADEGYKWMASNN